jgi:hypothetical protein
VGNVFGRDEHEKQISRIMMDMGQLLGSDSSENRLISNIASAHGGKVNGSKDTISRLPAVTKIERDIHIRPQLLAAVLRFADEIAEDRSRAFPLASAQGLITKSSEVFHAYADRLGRVYVGDNSVSLKFEIDLSLITKLFGKGDKEVYLIDEILNRSYKMHLERLYCMRYMRPYINIFSIEVEIGVYTDKYYTEKDKIHYVLEESGYPEDDQDRLYARTHLVTHQGKPMNGPNLIEDLRSRSILT